MRNVMREETERFDSVDDEELVWKWIDLFFENESSFRRCFVGCFVSRLHSPERILSKLRMETENDEKDVWIWTERHKIFGHRTVG